MRKIQMRVGLRAYQTFAAAPNRHTIWKAGERKTIPADNAKAFRPRFAPAEINEAPTRFAARGREARP